MDLLTDFLSWDEMKDVMSDKLMSMEDVLFLRDNVVKCVGKDTLDPDTFLRLNIALDNVLDERDAEGLLSLPHHWLEQRRRQ